MKPIKKLCLVVNQQGFISIYALLWLQISMLFISMMVNRCTAFALSNHEEDYVEIFAIHHVKEAFEADELEAEEVTWKQYTLFFSYEELIGDVVIKKGNHYVMHERIEYDDICQCVMKIEYR